MAVDKNLEIIREYFEVSEKLNNMSIESDEYKKLVLRQAELCALINSGKTESTDTTDKTNKTNKTEGKITDPSSLTIEEKLEYYKQGKAHLLPDDSYGKLHGGKIFPTEEEVMIGMYPDRSIFEFNQFTCGIYRFYSINLPFEFNYIGYSQYIEYALHAQFCRWRSERNKPDLSRKRKAYIAKSLRYMLDKYPNNIRFEIVEEVPYSLLSAACWNQRAKHKCLWQYKVTNHKGKGFDPVKLEAGEYNY